MILGLVALILGAVMGGFQSIQRATTEPLSDNDAIAINLRQKAKDDPKCMFK